MICGSQHILFRLLDKFAGCAAVRTYAEAEFKSVRAISSKWPDCTYSFTGGGDALDRLSDRISAGEASSYLVLDLEQAESLESDLARLGFRAMEFWPCMCIHNRARESENALSELRMVRADERRGFDDWLQLAVHGFGKVESTLFTHLMGQGAELYTGYLRDRPVVSVMVDFDTQTSTGGLFYLVTHPEYTRRGIGTQTYLFCLERLHQLGIEEVGIQSSRSGYSAWKKIGMEDCGTMVLFYKYV